MIASIKPRPPSSYEIQLSADGVSVFYDMEPYILSQAIRNQVDPKGLQMAAKMIKDEKVRPSHDPFRIIGEKQYIELYLLAAQNLSEDLDDFGYVVDQFRVTTLTDNSSSSHNFFSRLLDDIGHGFDPSTIEPDYITGLDTKRQYAAEMTEIFKQAILDDRF